MFVCFFLVVYFSWPASHLAIPKYTLKIIQALGLGSFAMFFVWAFVFPIFLNGAFENVVKKIYLSKGEDILELKFFKSLNSSLYLIRKTLIWRLGWLFLSFISAIFFSSIGLIISQVAIGHIAVLDASDLALTVRGVENSKRFKLLQDNSLGILSGGLIGGLFGFILATTVIGWIFWLPSVYVGTALWVLYWEEI